MDARLGQRTRNSRPGKPGGSSRRVGGQPPQNSRPGCLVREASLICTGTKGEPQGSTSFVACPTVRKLGSCSPTVLQGGVTSGLYLGSPAVCLFHPMNPASQWRAAPMECLSTNAEPTGCSPVKQGLHARGGHEKEQVSPSAWEQRGFKKVYGNHEGRGLAWVRWPFGGNPDRVYNSGS